MPTAEKAEKVQEIKERLTASEAALLADYRGLTVKELAELRQSLREVGATFNVVKNTLTKRAATEAGLEDLGRYLEGPTAVTFVDGDPIAAAKRLADAARRLPALEVKGGLMEGRVLSADQARALATVDPREVSIAKVAGMLQAPLARMTYLLQAPLQRMAYALAERGRQTQG